MSSTLDQVCGPLTGPSHARADLELVVTELLTNATRGCRSRVDVELVVHHRWVEVEVTDDGAGEPERRDAKPTDTGGRGLAIVDALSAAWGVRPAPVGKTVWARLRLEPLASQPMLCDVPEPAGS